MNYQLARTNTYLGGQLKLDLTINKGQNALYIEDFHMSPISNYTGFAWGADSGLLNSRHSENIKEYYKKTKNIFYEECLNPTLDTKYPIYSPNYLIDAHSVDDKMGLYRLSRKTYKKSYAFFCPFWITDASKFLGTEFHFKLYRYKDNNPISDETFDEDNERKHLVFTSILHMNELVGKTFHNNFVKYFDEYLKGFASHEYDIKDTKFLSSNVVSQDYKITLDENQEYKQKQTSIEEVLAEPFLNEDLLYISFKDGQAWAKGIDPSSGSYMSKDVSYICETLLAKERPLMDNDYYLARIFKDNLLIAQQLVNFNFIFDLSDILLHIIYEEMQYKKIGVEVEIWQDGQKLALKDFYSNYEFIPKAKIISSLLGGFPRISYDTDENVLDYKNNSNYIEYAYKNKLIQNIVHWSVGDSEYIFNLFDGFSPNYGAEILFLNQQLNSSSGIMPGSPNIASSEFNLADQNVMWANIGLFSNPAEYESTYTYFSADKNIINGVRYDFSKLPNESKDKYFWVLLCPNNSDSIVYDITPILGKFIITINSKIGNLTFQKIYQDLSAAVAGGNIPLNEIYKKHLFEFMKCAIMQSVFILKDKYISKIAESPNKNSKEVNFSVPKVNFKDNHPLYRYDGSLQPMMIDIEDSPFFNYSNYVKQYEETLDKLSQYSRYTNTKYEPNYPSIGYSSIEHEDIDYSSAPLITYYGEDRETAEKYFGERRWYNGSFMFTLPQKIVVHSIESKFDINNIYSGFVEEVKTRMPIDSLSDEEYVRFVMNYILPLYKYDLSYEKNYEEGTNIPILDDYNEITYKYTADFNLI